MEHAKKLENNVYIMGVYIDFLVEKMKIERECQDKMMHLSNIYLGTLKPFQPRYCYFSDSDFEDSRCNLAKRISEYITQESLHHSRLCMKVLDAEDFLRKAGNKLQEFLTSICLLQTSISDEGKVSEKEKGKVKVAKEKLEDAKADVAQVIGKMELAEKHPQTNTVGVIRMREKDLADKKKKVETLTDAYQKQMQKEVDAINQYPIKLQAIISKLDVLEEKSTACFKKTLAEIEAKQGEFSIVKRRTEERNAPSANSLSQSQSTTLPDGPMYCTTNNNANSNPSCLQSGNPENRSEMNLRPLSVDADSQSQLIERPKALSQAESRNRNNRDPTVDMGPGMHGGGDGDGPSHSHSFHPRVNGRVTSDADHNHGRGNGKSNSIVTSLEAIPRDQMEQIDALKGEATEPDLENQEHGKDKIRLNYKILNAINDFVSSHITKLYHKRSEFFENSESEIV